MRKKTNLLVFDIDGTLLLTGGAGKVAFELIFEEMFGIKKAWKNVQPHGKTDQIIFQEVAVSALQREMTPAELTALSEGYLRYFDGALETTGNFRVLPGVPELIARLDKESNLLLGIGTGNYKRAADSKLRFAKLKDYFHFGGYACDSAVRVELIAAAIQKGRDAAFETGVEVDRTFVIGDTPFDVIAGKENGAVTIGVTTGIHDVDDLKPYNPNHILTDLSNHNQFYDIIRSY